MSLLPTTNYKLWISCKTFNHASYIEETMNGFCMQKTDFPFVAIIIDDASTDGEPDVIRNYLEAHFDMDNAQYDENNDAKTTFAIHKTNANCHFLVIYLKYNFYSIKKNKYPLFKSWCENVPYVASCEGDDYWTDPNKLQRQVTFLFNSTDYLAVAENSIIYNTIEDTRTLFSTKQERDLTLEEIISKRQFATASVLLSQKIYKAFQERTFNSRHDTMLWSFIVSNGKFKYKTDISSVYRRGKQGITEYTEPYKWASIVERWNKEIMLQFGHLYNKKISIDNIYNEYLKSLHKIYKRHGFCVNFFKCLFKCFYYKPITMTKHILKNIIK